MQCYVSEHKNRIWSLIRAGYGDDNKTNDTWEWYIYHIFQ
jgi:hypothetical protein